MSHLLDDIIKLVDSDPEVGFYITKYILSNNEKIQRFLDKHELNPDFAYLLNDIETFAIRFMGSVMTNDVKIKSLVDTKIKLVNRHKRNK